MEINDNQDIISLYDILKLFDNKFWEFWEKRHQFENDIYYNWKWYSFLSVNPFFSKFDYNTNQLQISISGIKFSYKKENDDVVLCKPSHEGQQILGESSDFISKFYDECLMYTEFNTQTSNNIKSVNSLFTINIFNEGIDLFLPNMGFKMNYRFYRYEENGYRYECNSDEFIKQIHGNEDELLKKIFVNINDCPNWVQSELYKKRKKQLKKEKRLKLVRKIFPEKNSINVELFN